MTTDDALRTRLASSLSGTYELERELGGGAMSRVFVAEETALGRRVVVKVLPPHLAEALSGERFVREIKVAARLQQANIVPVLRAGEIDGLPYYTMPFVTGETLRVTLAQGRLPVSKALAILRDVAKALAYAHDEGVVHRDIKPENVLLSGGTAVVTDFGIAKAISDSRTGGEHSPALTELGVTLGTPGYMAPEQAAGDPGTNERADLYAWGVMAYELLAGQHPFAHRRSAHDLMRAHMTEMPEHVAVRAPGVPLAVCDVVMRCLAKAPVERPPRASDVVDVLEHSVVSPADTAARTPMGLGKALAIYSGTFAAIAVAAKLSITGIGLPEWVFPGAIGVMLLGLPVVLLTGLIERQRTTMATAGHPSSATLATIMARHPQRFTWRHTTIGGVVAAVVFVLGVGAYMAMRGFGIGPFGSLIGSNALAARDLIVIADMQGPASDTALGDVLAEGMRVGLSESNALRLVSPEQVRKVLEQMERAGAAVRGEVARDVAIRATAKAVLDGDVQRVGSSAILTVRLLPADGGEPLVSLQETARDDADFSAATGRLARRLRERVGESLRRVNAALPLEQVTTASLPALRAYTRAMRAIVDGEYLTAMRGFNEAIALDSGFVGAYSLLGVMMQQLSFARHFQTELLQRAYDLRHKLPRAEQLRVEMNYWTAGPNPDLERAIVAGRTALAEQSGAVPSVRRLADLYLRTHDYRAAIDAAQEAIAVDSTFGESFYDLSRAYAELGQLDSAQAVIERFARTAPTHILVFMQRVAASLVAGEDSVAWAIARGLEASGNPLAVEVGAYYRISLAQRAGKLGEFDDASIVAARVGQARGSRMHAYAVALNRAWLAAYFRGDSARAMQLVDSALALHPLDSILPRDRDYNWFADVYGLARRPDRLRALVAAQERDDPKAFEEAEVPVLPMLRGELARAEGRPADALRHFREASASGASRAMLPSIGIAFLALGQKDSAVTYFERFLGSTSLNLNAFIEGRWLAEVRQRLAELYEERGEYRKARDLYAALVEQWRYADPELQPRVRQFRERMIMLERRGGD